MNSKKTSDAKATQKAAQLIEKADALLIAAGAGMNLDSGLVDFRNERNFWIAYPGYETMGVNFIDILNPIHFEEDPELVWGFFGNRLNKLRTIKPHAGFGFIKKWIRNLELDYFVMTSNVDGQFQKARYSKNKLCEIHGNVNLLQCAAPCSYDLWLNDIDFRIDEKSMRSRDIPICPKCDGIARPNILLLNDFTWISQLANDQFRRFEEFLASYEKKKLVILEIGVSADSEAISNVVEKVRSESKAKVIRINPHNANLGAPHVELVDTALNALQAIDKLL